jgi:hypothetical protein
MNFFPPTPDFLPLPRPRISEPSISKTRTGSTLAALFLILSLSLSSAQPKNPNPPPAPIDPAEGSRQARALVANLLAQKPSESFTNTAVLKIRDPDGKRHEIPVRYAMVSTPTNYASIYETEGPTNGFGSMKLIAIHSGEQLNEYLLSEPAHSEPKKLSGPDLNLPFAGSDFWLADLGIEFLHWPQQRVLKKEMRKGRSCYVLESTNPHPASSGYARVLSWIGLEHSEEMVLVHADAFDEHGNPLKQFDPKKLQKIHGAWQLEAMEMRNAKTGSQTIIEFDLK